MKSKIAFCIIATIIFLSIAGCQTSESLLLPIRIGWQIPWATQGQLTQVLVHTNLLENHGLQGEFVGFSYGGPLNEAALAKEVDVIFTADQPAAMLLSTGADWVIIGRLMYNRVAIYVPPDSSIKKIEDLKEKNVAIPFGAAAQRVALEVIQDAGLDPQTDVNSINLDILEQASVVASGTNQSWGEIDALVGFDPTPAIFEHEGKARMLHVGNVVSLILMSREFIDENPDAPELFLKAFVEAYYYYSTHQEQANDWFKEASNLTFDNTVLGIAASVEPNLTTKTINEIRITLSENDLIVLDEASEFIYKQGLVSKKVNMRNYVDLSYAENAFQSITNGNYDQSHILIEVP